MDLQAAIRALEAHKNERGMEHFAKLELEGLNSFGLGLGQIKKVAKTVGKDHELALQLWHSDNYDAKILSIFVEEAKKVDRAQVETQVAGLVHWGLANAYVKNLLSKVKFREELAIEWAESGDDMQRRVAFLLLSGMGKSKRTDDFFLPYIQRIEKELQSEENFVKEAMNNTLFYLGQRSKTLNEACISAAQNIGPVHVEYGDNSCEPVDVIKHLTGDRIQAKFS